MASSSSSSVVTSLDEWKGGRYPSVRSHVMLPVLTTSDFMLYVPWIPTKICEKVAAEESYKALIANPLLSTTKDHVQTVEERALMCALHFFRTIKQRYMPLVIRFPSADSKPPTTYIDAQKAQQAGHHLVASVGGHVLQRVPQGTSAFDVDKCPPYTPNLTPCVLVPGYSVFDRRDLSYPEDVRVGVSKRDLVAMGTGYQLCYYEVRGLSGLPKYMATLFAAAHANKDATKGVTYADFVKGCNPMNAKTGKQSEFLLTAAGSGAEYWVHPYWRPLSEKNHLLYVGEGDHFECLPAVQKKDAPVAQSSSSSSSESTKSSSSSSSSVPGRPAASKDAAVSRKRPLQQPDAPTPTATTTTTTQAAAAANGNSKAAAAAAATTVASASTAPQPPTKRTRMSTDAVSATTATAAAIPSSSAVSTAVSAPAPLDGELKQLKPGVGSVSSSASSTEKSKASVEKLVSIIETAGKQRRDKVMNMADKTHLSDAVREMHLQDLDAYMNVSVLFSRLLYAKRGIGADDLAKDQREALKGVMAHANNHPNCHAACNSLLRAIIEGSNADVALPNASVSTSTQQPPRQQQQQQQQRQ